MDTVYLKQVLENKQLFEADGRQALGVHLPAELAKALRWELHQYYGNDPGADLTTLYGIEVLSVDAPEIRFEA
ncbi:MAG: hypothetical protein G8237_05740 [Magnetococcales bacterium]|nr:hypothetical protein [Magnetococcales bacterium]NGZ05842.1 hypothetical protein [Magnetococcales bacterium]